MDIPSKTTPPSVMRLSTWTRLPSAWALMPARHFGKHCGGGSGWRQKPRPKDFICMAGWARQIDADGFVFRQNAHESKAARAFSRFYAGNHARIHAMPKSRQTGDPCRAWRAKLHARPRFCALTNFRSRTLPMPPFWDVCLRFCSTLVWWLSPPQPAAGRPLQGRAEQASVPAVYRFVENTHALLNWWPRGIIALPACRRGPFGSAHADRAHAPTLMRALTS